MIPSWHRGAPAASRREINKSRIFTPVSQLTKDKKMKIDKNNLLYDFCLVVFQDVHVMIFIGFGFLMSKDF